MSGLQGDPMAAAALVVLREFDVAMTARVAAANFDVVSETEAEELLERLSAFGHVREVEDGLYVKTGERDVFTRSSGVVVSSSSD